jgi:hypothetical protein
MTWQLLLFVVFVVLCIGFLYYLTFMELIIDSRGIQHTRRNYLRGPMILIDRLNKINNLNKEN